MSYFVQTTTTPRDLGGPELPRQAAARARTAVGWNENFYPKSGMGDFFSRDGFGTGMLVGAAAVLLLGVFGVLPKR